MTGVIGRSTDDGASVRRECRSTTPAMGSGHKGWRWNMARRRRLLLLITLGAALAAMGFGLAIGVDAQSDVLRKVHSVTAKFQSLEAAKKAGYERFYVCTEEPGVGTMGQHYVNFSLVGDPALDPLKPEALVYEPQRNGGYKLVALEWVRPGPKTNPDPEILGIPMKHVESGNRYGIEPDGFYSATTGCTSRTRTGRSPTGTRTCHAAARATTAADRASSRRHGGAGPSLARPLRDVRPGHG